MFPDLLQITADYATFNVHNTAEFECKCGAARCRGRVTGKDFLQPWLDEVCLCLWLRSLGGWVCICASVTCRVLACLKCEVC